MHLAAQGLAHPPATKASPTRLVKAIEQMRLLQIDTINVVNRSPYLVLYARLGSFPLGWLETVLAQGKIFEVWAHEASFAHVGDFAALHSNLNDRSHFGQRLAQKSLEQHGPQMLALLEHIRTHGPVRSSDFERPISEMKPKGGWWSWKAEKRWLEAWFATGKLMVARRDKFQRVYDLTEKVYPPSVNVLPVSREKIKATFIENSVRALGITPARWVHDYYRIKPRLKFDDNDLASLVAQGILQEVRVEVGAESGVESGVETNPEPWYVHRDHVKMLKLIVSGKALSPSHSAILSPFDPVVWDRQRGLELFNFDYRLECYTPEAKRRYGYFVLPILVRGTIVGRLDAKAHRAVNPANGIFEVKGLWLENGVIPSEALALQLAEMLIAFATWHGCKQLIIQDSVPKKFLSLLKKSVKKKTSDE